MELTRKLYNFTIVLFLIAVYCLAMPSANAAEDCAITIESNDKMQYNTKEIKVPKSCKSFEITLKHVGKMPKNIMGHNLVIAKAGDQAGVISDSGTAGAKASYVKPNDSRVLGATTVIGGGETAKTTLKVAKLDTKQAYTFFCTFPGHVFAMKGAIKLI